MDKHSFIGRRRLLSPVALAIRVAFAGVTICALSGVGAQTREVSASVLAGVTCSTGMSATSSEFAVCQSTTDSLKAYGIEPRLQCKDSAGKDLGCKPINTDDMQFVLATTKEMASAM